METHVLRLVRGWAVDRARRRVEVLRVFSHEATDVWCAILGSEADRATRPVLHEQWCFGCPTSEPFHEGDALLPLGGCDVGSNLDGRNFLHERGWLAMVRGERVYWFCPTCLLGHEARVARKYLAEESPAALAPMVNRGLVYCAIRLEALHDGFEPRCVQAMGGGQHVGSSPVPAGSVLPNFRRSAFRSLLALIRRALP